MAGFHALALVMLQAGGDGSQTAHDNHMGVIWLCAIFVCLAAQAVGVCVAGAFAIKMFRKIEALTNSFEAKTAPVIQKTSALIDELTPKVRAIATNTEEISYSVREQCTELSATIADLNRTVRDANARTRAQVTRVDGLVSEALTTTAEVSKVVQEGIKGPVRQIAGVVAGVKAAVETLVARSPFPTRKRDVGDTEY